MAVEEYKPGQDDVLAYFGAKTSSGRNGMRKVGINAFSTIGVAAILAFSIGMFQLDLDNMDENRQKSLPILVGLAFVVGLSFLVAAARIASELELEKED